MHKINIYLTGLIQGSFGMIPVKLLGKLKTATQILVDPLVEGIECHLSQPSWSNKLGLLTEHDAKKCTKMQPTHSDLPLLLVL